MILKNKNIIVTGAAGVIGKHVVEILENKGANLRCFDLLPKPESFSKNTEYFSRDLSRLNNIEFINFNPDLIIHLAAIFERTVETENYWDLNFENEIILNHRVFDAARKCKYLKDFVFASSYLIYEPKLYLTKIPSKTVLKLKETSLVNPRNLCGISKLLGEREIEFLSNFHQFNVASARIFRVYGKGSKDVISRWIKATLSNETIDVFLDENMFDYIYAKDVAEGLIKISENNVQGIVNLGTGKSNRVSEIVDILKTFDRDLKIKKINIKGAMLESSCADITLLKKSTGWSPSTNLKDGIFKIINYQKNLFSE